MVWWRVVCDQSEKRKSDVEDVKKRVEANDPGAICVLANYYSRGLGGFQQDEEKAIELFTRAADLGYSHAHSQLGMHYHKGGDLKKAKFHCEVAAMAGYEAARFLLGITEANSGNMERAMKHWTIAASAGFYFAMHDLSTCFDEGSFSRESIDSTLNTYNNSCAEMRSEARDACIRTITETI